MKRDNSSNLTWHGALLDGQKREHLLDQRGCVLWFTGLSGSGKSTVAREVEQQLLRLGKNAYVLDGDNLRLGLNADLTFSAADRKENIRRVGSVAALFADAGVICLSAFISPYQSDRDQVRHRLSEGRFLEVHVATSLEECEQRDPKGLYAKARRGEITDFTGISAPYEPPQTPELTVNDQGQTLEEAVSAVMNMLTSRKLLQGNP
jgi:adenylylsulfate kinase